MDNPNISVNSKGEIVIVIPEDADEDELVIDLDKLGIDIEQLGQEVNIVVEVEGDDELKEGFLDDDVTVEPIEWYFDDDAYGIVYYEFPKEYWLGGING